MAVSGGNYKADNELQKKFDGHVSDSSSEIDSLTSGGERYGLFGWGLGKEDVVGITESMLEEITTAMDEYINKLTTKLNDLETDTVEYEKGFAGTGLQDSVKNFVIAVKDLCNSYLRNLRDAEVQLVTSVQEQYAASDADYADQLDSDATSVRSHIE